VAVEPDRNTSGVTLPEGPTSLAIRGQIFLNAEASPDRRAKPEKPGEHCSAAVEVEVNANACRPQDPSGRQQS
jgi:hypothetical protein